MFQACAVMQGKSDTGGRSLGPYDAESGEGSGFIYLASKLKAPACCRYPAQALKHPSPVFLSSPRDEGLGFIWPQSSWILPAAAVLPKP